MFPSVNNCLITVKQKINNKQCIFKLYFINYAITLVPIFPPLPPFTQHSPLPQAITTPVFMPMGHTYKFLAYSISYTVLYIPIAIL